MTNREAIEVIKLAQAQVEWEYPMDYAAAFDMAISALQEQELKQEVKNSNDLISRQALCKYALNQKDKSVTPNDIMRFPSAQPEPLSDAYMKAVWTWLLDYQIKAAKLKGRYTPYEVLSWVENDWRKEHEGSD